MIPELVEPRIVKHLYSKSAISHTPVSGTFELTPMCNMSCEMCYVRMTKSDLEKVEAVCGQWRNGWALRKQRKKQGCCSCC